MDFSRNRLTSLGLLVAASSAVVALILITLVVLEYQYSKHFFTIERLWYQMTFPWNRLKHVFFLNYGGYESALFLAMILGTVGAVAWRCVYSRNYPRGVALTLLSAFAVSYAASFFTRRATFSEMLVLSTIQVSVVIAFVTFCRRADPLLRFNLRSLLGLSVLVALFLVMPGLLEVDWPFRSDKNIASVIFLDQSKHLGPVNMWLPLLGLSAGIMTIIFLSNSKADWGIRLGYLIVVAVWASAHGYCLAWAFETFPMLRWGYGNIMGFRGFHYAYAVLFPLIGLSSLAGAAFISVCSVGVGFRQRPLDGDGAD